jgi:hypothetical protein
MYLELSAYRSYVFLDFHLVHENEWSHYAILNESLAGRGVPSIDEALRELHLQPLHQAYRQVVNADMLRWLFNNRTLNGITPETEPQAMDEVREQVAALLNQIIEITAGHGDVHAISSDISKQVETALVLPVLTERSHDNANRLLSYLSQDPDGDSLSSDNPATWGTMICYLVTKDLGRVITDAEWRPETFSTIPTEEPNLTGDASGRISHNQLSRAWIDEWLLGKIIAQTLVDLGLTEESAWKKLNLIKNLTAHQTWYMNISEDIPAPGDVLNTWLIDPELQGYLGVNRHEDVLWYRAEAFKHWLWWAFVSSVIWVTSTGARNPKISPKMTAKRILSCWNIIEKMIKADSESEYRVDQLMKMLND